MSALTRYHLFERQGKQPMHVSDRGEWVKYEDYAALRAQLKSCELTIEAVCNKVMSFFPEAKDMEDCYNAIQAIATQHAALVEALKCLVAAASAIINGPTVLQLAEDIVQNNQPVPVYVTQAYVNELWNQLVEAKTQAQQALARGKEEECTLRKTS